MVTGPTVMRLPSDLARFRAHRRVQEDYTYIRLTGNLATLPPEALLNASEGTTVVDLEAVVFERGEMSAWRTYIQTAKSKVRSLQLLGCPPRFLETALSPNDLEDKVQVRTFALRHPCDKCNTMTTQVIDVAKHLEQLVSGELPATLCISCRSSLVAPVTYEQIALLRALPERDNDGALETFLAQARAEPLDKLENCLAPLQLRPAKPPPPRSKRRLYVAATVGVLLIGGVTVKVLNLGNEPTTKVPAVVVAPDDKVVTPAKPLTFTRPDWIISDVPASASCHDMFNGLTCVGISSYRSNRDEGAAEATDAALDELVSAVGLKITTPAFRDTIMSGYSDARTKALYELQTTNADVDDRVLNARRRVVKALLASGGGGVPAQRSDWHWEEFARDGGGSEFLVFVRYDISLDAVRALVEKYSTTTTVGGSRAMTAFPALAWRRQDFTGGALLTKVGHPFADAGIPPNSIIVAVGDQRVVDAPGFARILDQSPHGEVKITIAVGDDAEKVISIRR